MPVIPENDIKQIEAVKHGVLAAGKTISVTVDGVSQTYTVPTGKKLKYSLILSGQVETA